MKKLLGALPVLVLLLTLCPAWGVELPVQAEAALLMEKETGQVLYAKNEHQALEPASVTKVMTLLLVMEAIDRGTLAYDDVVTVSDYAASMGGSRIFLSPGEQITVEDLLKGVCVSSGNDAAVALAEKTAGVTELFVERMNNRARELGDAGHPFRQLHRSSGGGARHQRLGHRRDVPGADRESPGHPAVYHHLDGHPAGRTVPTVQHQQAHPLL